MKKNKNQLNLKSRTVQLHFGKNSKPEDTSCAKHYGS